MTPASDHLVSENTTTEQGLTGPVAHQAQDPAACALAPAASRGAALQGGPGLAAAPVAASPGGSTPLPARTPHPPAPGGGQDTGAAAVLTVLAGVQQARQQHGRRRAR